jgi:hypothetical protein
MVTPLCMWGNLDGIDVTAYAARTGAHAYGLRVWVRFPRPLGAGLHVRPKASFDGLAKLFGAQDHLLGDPPFDDAFVVKAPSAAIAASILDAPLRAALLGLYGSLGPITLSDEGLGVELPYVPAEPSLVPRLVHHLTGVAETIVSRARTAERVGPYR